MLHQTLPGVPEAVDDARAWVRTAVLARFPNVAVAHAVQVAGELVAAAVDHTPPGGVVEINLKATEGGALVIEVKDVNSPSHPHDSAWGGISRVVRQFGTSTTEQGGHIAWCEIPAVSA